ncbi:unnamed protein product [Phytophthora fragariaefolia]|uniref:Unnamed protein product n=1 Tax=Phytophthora fragariaefolia TaxID=1490495 RepID=A0A9W6Y5V9_9STRA|nr:unnamed protein product [Phytophthora fragariaefolia]
MYVSAGFTSITDESRLSKLALNRFMDQYVLSDDDTEALYQIKSVLRVDVNSGQTDGDSITLGSIENRFPHTVNELSLNYPVSGSTVLKDPFKPLDRYYHQAAQATDDASVFQMAYDVAYAAFIKQSTVDSELEHMRVMIGMLGDHHFRDKESWVEIIRALASAKNRYYSIAVMAALGRAGDLLTWEQFTHDWESAISSRNKDRIKYSPNLIRYWAEQDAPSQMRRYLEEEVRNMLVNDVRNSLVQGRIHHSHIVSYIYFRFRNIYAAYNFTKSIAHWYEFVTSNSRDAEPGQLYKWRCVGVQPDSIFEYISTEFKDIVVRVHSDLRSLTANTPSGPPSNPSTNGVVANDQDAKLRHPKALLKAFDSCIVSISNNKFKRSVVAECSIQFKWHHFIKQIDRTPHILGVGNGIVEFDGPNVTLLTGYHTYPITLYTDTNYIPYDEENQFVQTVYRMLRSLVPEDEIDALDFVLYYFSTSLDWLPKESLFLIIHGGGCHAANTPIRMFDGSVKLVQYVKVGDLLMGDDNKPRKVLDLDRGLDRMIQVTFNYEDYSFEVNEHHILSLKLMDVHEVVTQRDDRDAKHYATWHRLNGSNGATRVEVPFATVVAAKTYLASVLCSDKRAIHRGDVIDIELSRFVRWGKSWMTRVALHRPGPVEYPEKSLCDTYEFGKWLGTLAIRNPLVGIPNEYKTTSVRQRFELLAGLLDRCTPEKRYELTLPYGAMLSDCIELIYSLGLGCLKVYAPGCNRETWCCLVIRGPVFHRIPCRIRRQRVSPHEEVLTSQFSIHYTRPNAYYGFEVDGNHRYLTADYNVHHNSNGKSVLMELFRPVMELKDARLVYYSESDRNEKVNVAKVKEVTGGEALSGRQLYKEQENFRGNCNHIVTTNHRFVIETTEHAVWRRFMSYRFKICFKHDCDPTNPMERPSTGS